MGLSRRSEQLMVLRRSADCTRGEGRLVLDQVEEVWVVNIIPFARKYVGGNRCVVSLFLFLDNRLGIPGGRDHQLSNINI